ncbi:MULTISPECIES: urease accessory protein UreE [Marinobacter]|uniref:Urease accessory protein UreE n=1 Tax=Marinobacter profundi TaxID=2666256 RepID=A0A2G1UN41_9GAMM|nr:MULTISPECIES: urease accessory protein UreE [Marinobacter]MBD3658648.1 urease accessory protein UreE [Marinobacter sp.]PHQ15914.1 urease accessory protein UreE [Marinobacter profundi]
MLELTQRIENVDASEVLDTLTLPYELRIRGRLRATTDTNQDVGLFLDRGPVLRHGACLQATSGEIVRIRAAEEPVVTARIATGLPLARLCYHLGNRHTSLAIGMDSEQVGWVRFTPDHVLEELAEHLGATLEHHNAPFDPEPGAYAQPGHSHGHGHGHSHGHAHHHHDHEGGHSHSEHHHDHTHAH